MSFVMPIICNTIQQQIERIKKEAAVCRTRSEILLNTLKSLKFGDIFEFGVFTGRSLKFIADNTTNKKIYAFDSFKGLPEAWPGARSAKYTKGYFNVGGKLPNINNTNIHYIKGFFEDSLPLFVKNYNNAVSFIHIDCDIYSSTKTILSYMKPYIKKNTMILFDELIGYRDFEQNEIKAWTEFVQETELDYTYLYSSRYQVSLQIL